MTPLELAAQALADDKVATRGPWKCEQSWNNAGMPLSDFSIPGSNLDATVEMLSVDACHIVNMRSREPILAQALIDQDKLHQFAISQLNGQIEELRAQSIESHRFQGIAERERDALKEECERLRGHEAVAILSDHLGLGSPVRPDIHSRVVRQRNDFLAKYEEHLSGYTAALAVIHKVSTELAAMTAARDRACAGWADCFTLEGNEAAMPDEIAEIRAVGAKIS